MPSWRFDKLQLAQRLSGWLGDGLRRQMQDQLAGLTGATAQFNPRAGREGLRVEAQAEGQDLVVADQAGTGEQLLRAVLVIDHQQRQFDFGAGRHALQGAAQFTLMRRQRAEFGGLFGFFWACCGAGPGVGGCGLGASLPQATSRLKRLSKTSGRNGIGSSGKMKSMDQTIMPFCIPQSLWLVLPPGCATMALPFLLPATMHCPFCGANDTKVIDSRLVAEGEQVRRRRECLACGERFTTFETAELVLPRLIKTDGSRQPFDEEKLRAGMQRALEKRPVSVERLESSLVHIKHKLRATGEREVKSLVVGELVMAELQKLDEVAYIRFASVYKRFQDLNEFREEIDRLAREPVKE